MSVLYLTAGAIKNGLVCDEQRQQCRDLSFGYNEDVITYPDKVEVQKEKLIFWHRNRDEYLVWDKLIAQQHLEEISHLIPNPLKNRTMGGQIKLDGFSYKGIKENKYQGCDHKQYHFLAEDVDSADLVVTLHTFQCATVDEWKKQLTQKAEISSCKENAKRWWNGYFDKSYILIDMDNEDSDWFEISRNYQLFRYMLGCNYYGEYPTKFNGGPVYF